MKGFFVIATASLLMCGVANALPNDKVEAAMHQIGGAYFCGAPYEYADALANLKAQLIDIGVPDTLAQYSVDGIDKFVTAQHAANRNSVTKQECRDKYGRG